MKVPTKASEVLIFQQQNRPISMLFKRRKYQGQWKILELFGGCQPSRANHQFDEYL